MSAFHHLKVKEVTKETARAVSIVFELPDKLRANFKFQAGQYITIKAELEGEVLRRSYSLCSGPMDSDFRIAVQAIPNGKFSIYATEKIKVGDVFEVSEPEGKFILDTDKASEMHYVGIAAGSGITPILSMIKAVLQEESSSSFKLVFGNRTPEEVMFKTEIDTLSTKFGNRFSVHYIYSREDVEGALFGRIDAGHINYVLGSSSIKKPIDEVYICGPSEMIMAAKATMLEKGISEHDIHFELFKSDDTMNEAPKAVFAGMSEVEVMLDDELSTFTMNPKESVLSAVLDEGLDPPYSCQGGICSSCLAKVTEGHAIMDKNSVLSEAEIKEGLVLTCQAHPTTHKISVDYDDV